MFILMNPNSPAYPQLWTGVQATPYTNNLQISESDNFATQISKSGNTAQIEQDENKVDENGAQIEEDETSEKLDENKVEEEEGKDMEEDMGENKTTVGKKGKGKKKRKQRKRRADQARKMKEEFAEKAQKEKQTEENTYKKDKHDKRQVEIVTEEEGGGEEKIGVIRDEDDNEITIVSPTALAENSSHSKSLSNLTPQLNANLTQEKQSITKNKKRKWV